MILHVPAGGEIMGMVIGVFALSAIGSGLFLLGRAHARRRRERRNAPPPPPVTRDR